jgi:hypothetical protein
MKACDKHGRIQDVAAIDPFATVKPSEVKPSAAIAEVRWAEKDDD